MRSIQPTNSAASWDSMSTMWCAAASFSSVCTFCSKITDWWSTAHPRPRVHRKPRWPLQRSPVSCRWRCYPTIAVSSAYCRAADHRRSDAKSTSHDTAWHSSLAGDITTHPSPSQLRWWCLTVLAADVRSSLLWWRVHSCTHRCCSFAIAISRPQWHRPPTLTARSVWLPRFPRVWTNNLEQTSTGFAKHRH